MRTNFITELLHIDTENHKDFDYKFVCASPCLLCATLWYNLKE